jgi:hypothetical protein
MDQVLPRRRYNDNHKVKFDSTVNWPTLLALLGLVLTGLAMSTKFENRITTMENNDRYRGSEITIIRGDIKDIKTDLRYVVKEVDKMQ